jgi:7-alpha-hydroxysteroid dehydrogenase
MILDRFTMTDKVAIVTGAGRGIGAASAVALAEAGADVVISARTADQLGAVARQIESAGRRAVVVAADLSDLEAVAALVDHARDAFGRLDLVVNNVGGAMPRPFMDTSPGRLEQAFHFNVSTAHALLRPAVPLMLEGDGGSVVNISSAMGRMAGRGYIAYGTAKGALAHYTRLAAADLSPRIRVNAIAVGSVATSALDIVMQTDELRLALEAGTPLKRIGDPEDIAATVVYLASQAGSYITGKIIEVDGGIESPNLDMGLPDITV